MSRLEYDTRQKAPRVETRRIDFCQFTDRLEGDLSGELDAARAASAEERIANSHVAGGCQRVITDAATRRVDTVDTGVGDEIRQLRVGKVGAVEQVEEFSAELQLHPLGNLGVLEHRAVELLERWSSERIACQVAEMPCARQAVGRV